jgi:hypothetical protein
LRTTEVGSGDPEAVCSSSPGYPPSTHRADEVLVSATVVSMVPAAPLLPATAAVSADVAQRTRPVATLVVDPGELVPGVEPGEVRAVVVVDPPEDDDPPGVVDGELDEHAPSRAPAVTTPATRATTTRERPADLVTLIDRLRPGPGTPEPRP